MKLGTRAAAYGLAGLALAGIVIFSGSTLGLLNTQPSGLLSILLTDPPTVPEGVTGVYVSYSGIAVHAVGFGDSGWVTVSGEGTINTLKLVNLSQTISSGTIPSLTYNQVRFTIAAASVEFKGKNYSAAISSGVLEVPIVGGLRVDSSNPSATLIDIQPTVLNLGGDSNPSFTIAAGARALQVPPSDVDQSTHVVGHTSSLEGHSWYDSFRSTHSENLSAAGFVLTPNSLSFSAKNQGSDSIGIRMIVVTQNFTGRMGGGEDNSYGSVMNGAMFVVQNDGTLKLLGGSPGEAESFFQGASYSLAAGATQHFSFSGSITNLAGTHSIKSGTSYYVVIVGDGTLSVQSVVAS